MNEVYLPSQHASAHDLPDDAETLRTVLAEAVGAALAHQQPDGNLEDPAADDDVGDMSLGVTSLLCLAWHRGDRRDGRLIEAVRRSVDFFLAERVYREDNPGEPFLRRRHSGEPHVRYMPGVGEHPFGTWPSTVWAMLHAVNVLDLGRGLLTDDQYEKMTDLSVGLWRWLTEASLFNPQGTANQAIGSIAAALTLARRLRSAGRADEGDRIAARAMALYRDEIMSACVVDRGIRLPVEHGAGHDQNYLPISLTFLARAHQVSGERCFLEDGDAIARHLEYRLSVRGFDFGGPRYSEQHCGFEGMLGLRFFSGRIRADLGRYLGDRRVAYYEPAKNGAPSGHFAFAAVWFLQDDGAWYRGDGAPVLTPYSLRHGQTSVSLTAKLTPYLIDAGGAAVIEAVIGRQHGIGPVVRYTDSRPMLLTRPLGPMRTRDVVENGFAAKLVTKAVVTRDRQMLPVQQLYVSDGERLHLICVVDRGSSLRDVRVDFLAGLPYATADGERQRRIREVATPAFSSEPSVYRLGECAPNLLTDGPLRAGGMSIAPAGDMLVTSPPPGAEHVNSPETVALTQEQIAFALTDDPRGYGDPDVGWQRVAQTNHLFVEPLHDAPEGLAVFVVRYGRADGADTRPLQASAEATPEGVLVRTSAFTALVGHPDGDADGEPLLRLERP